MLILPNCTREAAEIRRIELQERISRIRLELWPETIVPLGASAGVAVFPDDGTTHEVLIAEADRRMYQDKASRRSGRHRAATRARTPFAPRAAVVSNTTVTSRLTGVNPATRTLEQTII